MIPVYQPWITNLEKKYLNQAVDSSWISSNGYFIDKAEELFADFIGTKHCIVTTSGTTALHLCLRALDLPCSHNRSNQRVAIPDTTFIATAFAASYNQRSIEFIDADPNTWNIDINELEKRLEDGEQYDIIIPVHLYGNPCDMKSLDALKRQYGFKIVEDACESIGATIGGQKTGTFGDVACFSFYGNKTFTCGEGGAVVTNDDQLASRIRLLRGQAQDIKRYWHIDIGYNYRMTNLQAAILCGQIERADEILCEKQRVAERYRKNLEGMFDFQRVLPGHHHGNWIISLLLPIKQDTVAAKMKKLAIETRKVFYPISTMPPYAKSASNPVAQKLSEYGISLPSFPQLTDNQIDYISQQLRQCI